MEYKHSKRTIYLSFWAYWILIALTVVIQLFVEESGARDYKLIITMALCTVMYPFVRKKVDRQELLLAIVFILILISSLTVHIKSANLSGVFYSAMFFFTFLLYKNLCLFNYVRFRPFLSFIKWMIIAFFVVLVIQQVQWAIGMTPFNDRYFEGIKRPSLAMEPSNTTIVMPVLLYVFMKLMEIARSEKKYSFTHIFHKDKWIWFAGLYVCLTCGSMTIVFTLPVLFCYFIKRNFFLYSPLIIVFLIAAVLFIRTTQRDMYDRFSTLVENVDKIDSNTIVLVDPSAACRFVPYIEYIKSIDLTKEETWLGHGAGELEKKCNLIIVNDENVNIGAGTIANLFYDNGLIIGLLFFMFLIPNVASRFWSFDTFFYFGVMSVMSMNRNVLWMYICMMFTVLYFQRNIAIIKNR